jgi:hypothetical protein
MTRFDELCHALSAARKKYLRWRSDFIVFAEELRDNLQEYLSSPIDKVKFAPLNEPRHRDAVYSVREALFLDADTVWHLGIAITLYEMPGGVGEETHILDIQITKKTGKYLLQLAPHSQEFTVDSGERATFQPFFDFIFAELTRYYDEGLTDFLEHGENVRHIGFTH